jgi:prolyl-tRNA synthetase
MFIWNVIRKWFQERIEDMGVEETSFPMFLSSKSLEKVSRQNKIQILGEMRIELVIAMAC